MLRFMSCLWLMEHPEAQLDDLREFMKSVCSCPPPDIPADFTSFLSAVSPYIQATRGHVPNRDVQEHLRLHTCLSPLQHKVLVDNSLELFARCSRRFENTVLETKPLYQTWPENQEWTFTQEEDEEADVASENAIAEEEESDASEENNFDDAASQEEEKVFRDESDHFEPEYSPLPPPRASSVFSPPLPLSSQPSSPMSVMSAQPAISADVLGRFN